MLFKGVLGYGFATTKVNTPKPLKQSYNFTQDAQSSSTDLVKGYLTTNTKLIPSLLR